MKEGTTQSVQYICLQPTAAPSGYQETPASPDAASSRARNGVWPTTSIAIPIVEVPVDGRIMKPGDMPEFRHMQSGSSKK